MAVERSFRGITVRLAVHYLENLGGDLLDSTGDLAEAGATATVEGDGWRADLDSGQVRVGPSMSLTEVSVVFEGADGGDADLEELVDAFAQKAMRAGG